MSAILRCATDQTITDIERDDLHRPVSYTFGALAEQRQYDPLGRLSQWQLLHSQALAANQPDLLMRRRYGYDAASLLTHIDEQHFSAGNPAHNLLARCDYDRQGRLTGWTHSRFASPTAPEEILHQARYAFDAASNRLADRLALPIEALAGLAAYAEMPNARAVSAQEDWSDTVRANLYREDFDLLQAERRRPEAREPMGPEQGAGVRYRTDSRGNVIERQTTEGTHTHLSWDGANQLIEVAHRNAQGEAWQAQYVYDAFSRRVAKQRWRKDLAPTQAGSQAQPERFRFGWDGDRLAWQRDEQTREESAWLYRPDGTGFEPLARIRTLPQDNGPKAIAQRIEALMRGADLDRDEADENEDDEDNATPAIQAQALLQAMGLAPRKLHVEWFINDHLGTPRQVVDEQGETLWQTDYSPWGERLSSAETANSSTTKTDQPIRFQGQFEDEESGLYYNRYRYYDPRAGRYLSKDPIGLKGGVNLTSYVNNHPLVEIDPLGLFGDGTQPGVIEPTPYKGHSDFTGGSFFDYTAEDHDFWTHPYNPITGTWRHFRGREDGKLEAEVDAAIDKCDKGEFERKMHQLQDTYSHHDQGYDFAPFTKDAEHDLGFGHMFSGTKPDENMDQWELAENHTKNKVAAWKARGCKCTGL